MTSARAIHSISSSSSTPLSPQVARSILTQIVMLTEPLREEDAWLHGPTLAAQNAFAPTLLQRMEQANSGGKLAMVSAQVGEIKYIMQNNIEVLLQQEEKLELLDEKVSLGSIEGA